MFSATVGIFVNVYQWLLLNVFNFFLLQLVPEGKRLYFNVSMKLLTSQERTRHLLLIDPFRVLRILQTARYFVH